MPGLVWPPLYPRGIEPPRCSVPENLRHAAARYPDRIAVGLDEAPVSYLDGVGAQRRHRDPSAA